MGSSCGSDEFSSAENIKALSQRVSFYQVGQTQGSLTVEAFFALTMVLPCLSAAPAKAKPAAAPPPPATPEPVAAAAPPPAAAPIPTTMPPVPPVSTQPIDSKPGEAASVFSYFQTSFLWGECVRLKTTNSVAFMVKSSLCYDPACSRLEPCSAWYLHSPVQGCFCSVLLEQGVQMGFLPQSVAIKPWLPFLTDVFSTLSVCSEAGCSPSGSSSWGGSAQQRCQIRA